MTTDTNRPAFRKVHAKRVVVERWCDENGISRDMIRKINKSGTYGYGELGCFKYVVDWQD